MKYTEDLFLQAMKIKQLATAVEASGWGLGHLLGLVVHEKYVSLAVSDPDNSTAFSLSPLDREKYGTMNAMADQLNDLVSKYNVCGFVFGEDLVMHDVNFLEYRTERFIDGLRNTARLEGLLYEDGRYYFGLKHAESMLKYLNAPEDVAKNFVVRTSALGVLQSYLDDYSAYPERYWRRL